MNNETHGTHNASGSTSSGTRSREPRSGRGSIPLTERIPVIGPEDGYAPNPGNTIGDLDSMGRGARSLRPEPKRNGGRVALIAVLTVVVILGVVYGAGVAAFHFMFMPNTTLDGQDVSLKFANEVGNAYSDKVGTYQVSVEGDGLSFTVRGSDIGLAFDENAYEQGALEQQDPWAWPLEVLGSRDLKATAGATFDAERLKASAVDIINAFNAHATQPTNASIAFDGASQQFAVVPEQVGTAVDADKLTSILSDAVNGMVTRVTVDQTCLLAPAIKGDDPALASAVQNANTFLTANIPLTLNGKEAGVVTREQISQWIILGDDNSATLDEDKVAEWVKANVGKLDTVGATRTYTRADGKQITVDAGSRSSYGWITNEADTTSQLVAAIKGGSTSAIEIPVRQAAASMPDANGRDWGDRYIDIDLSEQHVRMYDDSGALVWESDCVSGNSSKDYDTPTGVYQLNSYRASGDVELRGKIDPETNEPEYISHVEYWMPFIGNSWALHDADWRSSFGGSIYKTGGSHGCVNLPPSKAAELFNICKVGDVVVVHN